MLIPVLIVRTSSSHAHSLSLILLYLSYQFLHNRQQHPIFILQIASPILHLTLFHQTPQILLFEKPHKKCQEHPCHGQPITITFTRIQQQQRIDMGGTCAFLYFVGIDCDCLLVRRVVVVAELLD